MDDEKLTKRQKRELAKQEKKEERQREEKKSSLTKTLLTLGVVAVLGFLGYRFISWLTAPTPEVVTQPMEITEDDWIRGAEEAEVTIVEYGDFQCPSCATYEPILQQAVDEVPGVRLVYRHLPLVSIHPNAIPAAKASEAAGIQGKFWEMHDRLFEEQANWSGERNPFGTFETYAQELGLDTEQFRQDYESEAVETAVNTDLFSANRLSLSSTPSIFVEGETVDLPFTYEEFKEILEQQKVTTDQ